MKQTVEQKKITDIMKTSVKILAVMLLFITCSCEEESILKPFGKNDGTPPGTVSITSYEKVPGGAVVTFKSPADTDLMYIKAKYTLDTGVEREVRVSTYSNTIRIDGFGNTQPKTITFSAIDRMENEGNTINTEIVPGEPAYLTVSETLDVSGTFGGVAVNLMNENRGDVIIEVTTQDNLGEWAEIHTEYTSTDLIRFAVRGYDTIPRIFGVSVRDPWGNQTEASYKEVTPLFEEQIPLSGFRPVILQNDTPVDAWGFSMENLWNGNVSPNAWSMIHSSENNTTWPIWYTFDMGAIANLSRFQYWQRLDDAYVFTHGNMKTWEMWGTADQPASSGSWDGWTLLMECTSIKPSGLAVGSTSAEDLEYARAGEEFEFPLGLPPVRYIRVKVLETFSGNKFIHTQQMWFFGKIVE